MGTLTNPNSAKTLSQEGILRLQHAVRQLCFVLMGICAFTFMTAPGMLILTTEESLLYKAVSLTHWPATSLTHWPLELGYTFVALSLLVLPHQLVAAFWPRLSTHPNAWLRKLSRRLAKLAVLSFFASSVLWLYLLRLSWNMGAGALPVVLLFNMGGCAAVSFVLSDILNKELAELQLVHEVTDLEGCHA